VAPAGGGRAGRDRPAGGLLLEPASPDSRAAQAGRGVGQTCRRGARGHAAGRPGHDRSGPGCRSRRPERAGLAESHQPTDHRLHPARRRRSAENQLKLFTDFLASKLGVPAEATITTSYAALVEAQRNRFAIVGYYGPLSFLLAEQQFGAILIMVDSADGKTPGHYNSLLLAGKDSPVKRVADIRGKDFSFADPASASGNLFPRVMLIKSGIDPNKDIKGRFAGSHLNSILAVAKGQVPCGASNNLSVQAALDKDQVTKDDLVTLQTSDDIPNGPFAVRPDLDPGAVKKLQAAMAEFDDLAVLKSMQLVGRLIPTDTSNYNFVREAARTINLQFDEKGVPKPIGEGRGGRHRPAELRRCPVGAAGRLDG
jgi:phosphonate transport system substrate-binding protein